MKRYLQFITISIYLLLIPSQAITESVCPVDPATLKPKEVTSLEEFVKLAVLEQGRIKPFDSYARNILLQFSGKKSFQKKPAKVWLARLIFAPETTRDDKIFLINNPQIPMALEIDPEKKRHYSFNQVAGGFEKLLSLAQAAEKIEEKERSLVENEIIRLYQNFNLYVQLSQSFLFAFPNADFTATRPKVIEQLGLSKKQNMFSYIDIALQADKLYAASQHLERTPEQDWTEDDKELLNLMNNLYQWSFPYQNLPFTIIPSYEKNQDGWISPWDALTQGVRTPETRVEITALRDLMIAYWNGQQLEFDLAARSFRDIIKKRLEQKHSGLLRHFPIELFYNRVNPFLWAKLCYGLALIIFFTSLLTPQWNFRKMAFRIILLGFIFHFSGVAMRIYILSRPPVSTLYETFVFVAGMSVVLGIIMERIQKQWLGIVVASTCGFIFLTIAGKFNTDGDSLRMLVAVLNSNFWLSTHVLSITTGYAGCCVAGLVGHIFLIQALLKSSDKILLDQTYRNLIGILGFGLTMTFLGTNLGGIWADQSWGRFWGWDPKENGALLIIIWTAMIFHARVGKMIGPVGVAAGSVLGILVVMWAWFGVNFLSVGLHSYGFTSGVATGLIIYGSAELLFIGITVSILCKRGWKF